MKLAATHSPKSLLLPLCLLGLYLALGLFFLKDYLLWDSQWLLALVLLPLVAQVRPEQSLSPVLLLSAAPLGIMAVGLHNSTFYFFCFLISLLCGAQLLLGRISLFPLLLLAVASPIFKYVANIISFPLRLQLSSWAVQSLQAIGKDAEAAGNIILVNGEEFSVDPACAGLSMLSLSLILAVFVLAHLQRREKKSWPLWLMVSMLGLMLLLNLGSNLLRILLLVLFKVLPNNPMHDVLGLLCLLFYALLPFFFLARPLLHRFGKQVKEKPENKPIRLRIKLLLNSLLLLMLLGVGISVQRQKPKGTERITPQLAGFVKETMPNGVTKYSSKAALVYLKPVNAFYSTEHHPLICWEGSGYKFKQVQARQIARNTVYVGELEKGSETLYTAWWMDNGQHRTIEQLDWRWRMLKGEAQFRLVNVTAAKKEELNDAILGVLAQSESKRMSIAHLSSAATSKRFLGFT